MSLIIKAYLTMRDTPEVIRRFTIDADVSSSYEYLNKKILLAFPELNGKSFSINWKDGEGDLISFSSDDELMLALTQVDQGVLKLYIKLRDLPPHSHSPFFPGAFPFMPPMQGRSPNTHFGVTCDGCGGGVDGTRYKCVECPDYDLCSACKQKNMHSEHAFREIRSPMHMFHDMMKQFGLGPQQSSKNQTEKMETTSKEGQEGEASNENAGQTFESQLGNIGDCIKAVLQPLGINLEIDIGLPEDSKPNQCAPRCCKKTSNNTDNAASNDVEMVDAEKTLNQRKPTFCPRQSPSEPKEGTTESTKASCADFNSCTTSNACASKAEGADASARKCCRKMNNEADANQSDSKSGCRRNWTGHAGGAAKQWCGGCRSECRAKVDGSTNGCRSGCMAKVDGSEWVNVEEEEIVFPGEEKNFLSEEKKTSEAVKTLLGMGFNDEGGWLTALVTATKGDVNKALDLMHAKH